MRSRHARRRRSASSSSAPASGSRRSSSSPSSCGRSAEVIYLGLIAVVTLIANSATRLRLIAVSFVGIAAVAGLIASATAPLPEVAVTAVAGLTAAGILFVAARDARYGEDPGWRLWLGAFTPGIRAPIAHASFPAVGGESRCSPPPHGGARRVVP